MFAYINFVGFSHTMQKNIFRFLFGFCLVFNSILTFLDYVMPKQFSQKENSLLFNSYLRRKRNSYHFPWVFVRKWTHSLRYHSPPYKAFHFRDFPLFGFYVKSNGKNSSQDSLNMATNFVISYQIVYLFIEGNGNGCVFSLSNPVSDSEYMLAVRLPPHAPPKKSGVPCMTLNYIWGWSSE